jgi:hypothetical protein
LIRLFKNTRWISVYDSLTINFVYAHGDFLRSRFRLYDQLAAMCRCGFGADASWRLMAEFCAPKVKLNRGGAARCRVQSNRAFAIQAFSTLTTV